MNILVTGASGFTGSVLARRLAESGHHITASYRRPSRFLDNLANTPRLTIRASDIRALESCNPFDAVVHAAATSPRPGVDANRMIYDNLEATRLLIGFAEAWRSRYFIFCSSVSLYGLIEEPVVDESTRVISPDVYGATKYLCELALKDRSERLSSLSLRLPGILGPGAQRNWIAGVADRLFRGEPIRAFNLDQPFNNAVYVHDIADLLLHVLEHSFEGAHSAVLGASGLITIREVIETLAQALNVPARIEIIREQKPSFYLSSARAIEMWAYNPLEIRQMLKRYAQDFLLWQSSSRPH